MLLSRAVNLLQLIAITRASRRLHIVADEAASLAANDEQIQILRNLVVQADRLHGARHYNHYDFLLALTDADSAPKGGGGGGGGGGEEPSV